MAVRNTILAVGLLALAVVGGTLAYQGLRARDYRELLGQGEAALSRGELFAAIEAYSGAIALRPDSMIAYLRRGETYEQRGEIDAAVRDYRVAATLDPAAPRPREAVGDALSRRGRYVRAAEAYEDRLRLDDSSAAVMNKLAFARYRAGNLDGALDAVKQSLELSDSAPEAHYLLGLCLRERGELATAIDAFERSIELAPQLAPPREELADLYASLGRRADELGQLRLLAEIDRGHPGREVAIAEALSRAGRRELAILSLGDALERMPDEPLLYTALGRTWLDTAELPSSRPDALPKALAALARVSSSENAGSGALTLYGRALLLSGQDEAAERALRRAVQAFPVDPDAFGALALASWRLGRSQAVRDALADYETLAATPEKFTTGVVGAARFAMLLDDPAGAAVLFAAAASTRPADVRLLIDLADAQLRSGDLDAARTTIRRGLQTYPREPTLIGLFHRSGE
jgi:tetratricopeptide (TPR) repeat protein